ncbi:pseudouridine-metabolizing bifunctional protein C1861.05 [Rhagoletis pomonella]|uniref:pseudouridine-metabolizing bifunctional protein C1861.05 n=1 Tax=Rhagoletis pomonella TaxID=28610 RepID=UPI001781D318|nr:pseudouridine-metabolizing bifunctional protein C1861.05 [Rhagoletis pomonella]XP_036318092.1 pseudouridine-metabolizing bifunctional protein C1861.05 [Rhagoletis pomonella]
MVWGVASPVLRASLKRTVPSQFRAFKSLIDIHPAVQQSLQQGEPVVALESTIITHGMPYPQNIDTSVAVEQIVSQNGALAATIAIINGRIKVGLTREEMRQLASNSHSEVVKCSRRDLPYLIAKKGNGGTTVAATMIIAHMMGIEIFATGGIGGVHRDGHVTFDISADLIELGRTPVTVVSSGIKSILDIPRTLEYLETQGVCVATYGVEDCSFPDFYTRDSGFKAPYNLRDPKEAANLIKSMRELKVGSGVLIGVPIPEQYAANKNIIEAAIQKAIGEADSQGISGKQVTPYLLEAIAKITKGSSLYANIALIKNNAKTAAKIAQELYKKDSSFTIGREPDNCATIAPLVIGASILDLSLTVVDDMPKVLDGATYRAKPTMSAGGVGRNIAECIFKLYGATNFISIVGNDQLGRSLLKMIPPQLRPLVRVDEQNGTSLGTLIFDKNGDSKIMLANMEIHQNITPDMIKGQEKLFRSTPIVVIDSNLSMETMECVLELAQKHQRPVFFEPTDMRIAHKPFTLARSLTKQIKFISPNIYELRTIVETITGTCVSNEDRKIDSIDSLLKEVKILLSLVEGYFDCIVLTLGQHGVVLNLEGETAASGKPLFDPNNGSYLPAGDSTKNVHSARYYAAPTVEKIKNVSGAGDSFTSGYITALLRGYDVERCIALGFLAAERALQSRSAVPGQFFNDNVEETKSLQGVMKDIKRYFL